MCQVNLKLAWWFWTKKFEKVNKSISVLTISLLSLFGKWFECWMSPLPEKAYLIVSSFFLLESWKITNIVEFSHPWKFIAKFDWNWMCGSGNIHVGSGGGVCVGGIPLSPPHLFAKKDILGIENCGNLLIILVHPPFLICFQH